ncbi:MAG: mucoidy inhibitor MuiA family protein [Nannocystaceae bacterium]|nr:mucoidy inhibitor MuiA family protein [Myxococcales bacterium]
MSEESSLSVVRELAAPVAEVTVLEDRAHVIRAGKVELPAGATRLRVVGVAPVLVDKTLCASIVAVTPLAEGEEPPRVADATVHRAWIVSHEEATTSTRESVEIVRALERELLILSGERSRVKQALAGLEAVAGATVEDINVDASWGQLDAAAAERQLEELAARELALRERLAAVEEELARKQQDKRRAEQRIAAGLTTADRMSASIRLEVVTSRPGAYLIRVDYVVPCACWRPYHRATLGEELSEGTCALTFATEGCVWQTTGEDWDDVALVFSTERPSLGADPPTLSDDLIQTRKRQEHIEVEVRQQTIQTTGEGREAQGVDELPGIDDGGEALELRAPHRAKVPSDGRPHRVPLSSFETGAEFERLVVAELAEGALLKTTQTNKGAAPILAGPVDLVRGGGLTGRGKLLYVAPGERFALGWGPDGAIRVLRSVETSVEQSRMLSSWTTTTYTITLRISNLGPEARALKVQERVPVSEIEKVKVAVDRKQTRGGAQPDGDGFLKWDVTLASFGREKVELVYELKKHSDVSGI